ncbi:transferase family-domain-containing protein [Mycena floridula]|nr:transferase family-domain-containing protein [Mycena floridula]
MSTEIVQVQSRSRIHAASLSQPQTVYLSILDCVVTTFAPTAALWLYDSPEDDIAIETLTAALRETLDLFPHFVGQLKSSDFKPDGRHKHRHMRLSLAFGHPEDPGVELVIAHCSKAISSFSSFSDFPSEQFLPDSTSPRLAMQDGVHFLGLPAVIVQITKFVDAGLAIAAKMSHPMADAQSLTCFMRHWAAIHRRMVEGITEGDLPPAPVFDPSLLDNRAVGDIDAQKADPEIVAQAHALPQHRYDWWASAEGCPEMMSNSTIPPSFIDKDIPLGNAMPWANWDLNAPACRREVFFSGEAIRAIWKSASDSLPKGSRISRFDALLAHVWKAVNRARGLDEEEICYASISIGVRSRLSPPFPFSFMGSPIVMARASTKPATPAYETAVQIRETILQFNEVTLPALFHSLAFEVTPQRIWNAFLGRKDLIVTSWLQLEIYELDFGPQARRPKYVEGIMPCMDGCIQIMEARPDPSVATVSGDRYEHGVNVSVNLECKAMEILLADLLKV